MIIPFWIICSLITGLFYALSSCLLVAIKNKNNLNPITLTSAFNFVTVIAGIIIISSCKLFPSFLSKNCFKDLYSGLFTSNVILFTIIGFLFFTAESAVNTSMIQAPSAAYSAAISNLYTVLTAVLPFIFFGTQLNITQFIGISLAVFSAYLINK